MQVDWLGAALLFSGISALLIAIGGDAGPPLAWLAATVVLLGGFVLAQRRAAEPILPLSLVRLPVISRTIVVVFLVGIAMFGAIAFIPLFVQSVQGGTATQAGQVLTPLFLGWVVMSIVGARITVRARLPRVGDRRQHPDDRRIPRPQPARQPLAANAAARELHDPRAPAWARRCCRCCSRCSTRSIDRSSGWPRRSTSSRAASARRSECPPWAPSSRAAWPDATLPGGAEACARLGCDRAVRARSRSVRRGAASRVRRGHRRLWCGAPGHDVPAAGGASRTACPPAAGEQMLEAEMTNLQPEDEPIAINE